jgi:hypothetical protein
MGEERQQAKHGDNFELQLLRLVRHPLRQRMQLKVKIADGHDGEDQKNSHRDHQHIRLAGRCDEARQMMGSQRVKLIAHMNLQFRSIASLECGRS